MIGYVEGGRGKVIDQRNQRDRRKSDHVDIDRLKQRGDRVAYNDQLIDSALAELEGYRKNAAVLTHMKRTILRQRDPGTACQHARTVLSDLLVHAPCRVSRKRIASDGLTDPRALERQDLQPRRRWHRLRQELCKDLAGALISAYQRRDLDCKGDGIGLMENLSLRIEAAIGKPLR